MRIQAIISLIALLLISGCATGDKQAFEVDHRRDFAYALLYQADGYENKAAFEAAIRARFPSGTPVQDMAVFFEKYGGECNIRETDHFVCQGSPQAGLCWARIVQTEAIIRDDVIEDITSVLIGGLGC